MKKATHYNRNDYYYPRSSKEAFGSNFYVTNKPKYLPEVAFVCIIIALLATLGSFL